MQTLLKSVIIVLALFFVCVKTVNADPACVPPNPNGGCFNGHVNISLTSFTSIGLTITDTSIGNPVVQPLPSSDVTGDAQVLREVRPVGLPVFSLDLTLGTISGQAGPGFGAVFITSTGQSTTLTLKNDGNQVGRFTFTATAMPHLHTMVAGFGTASMSYVFSVVMVNDKGESIGIIGDSPLQRTIGNSEFVTPFNIRREIEVPAGETRIIAIRGTITGNAAVPEPATMFLLGTGLAGIAIKMRKRLKKSQERGTITVCR